MLKHFFVVAFPATKVLFSLQKKTQWLQLFFFYYLMRSLCVCKELIIVTFFFLPFLSCFIFFFQKLRMAGCVIWMLTGDKFSTAKQVGMACNLIRRSYSQDHLLEIKGIEPNDVRKKTVLCVGICGVCVCGERGRSSLFASLFFFFFASL